MEAQTITWLFFLALIKHVSTSDLTSPFKVEPVGLLATEGSCSEIKCQVTRDVDYPDAYWFWMKDRRWVEKDLTATIIYSTNTSTRPVSPDFANRVKYIGSSSSSWKKSSSAEPKPLCSILICDLRTSDNGKYSMRFIGRERWFSEEVPLNVEVNRCPITFEEPAVVVESEVVTVSCSTSSSCPSEPHIQEVTQIDRTQVTGAHQEKERTTTFSFTASREDHRRVFSCQTQDNTDKYLIRNITVCVKYPPTEPILSMRSEVTEGQTIAVSCTAESFPQSTLTLIWINRNDTYLIITENNLHSRPINTLSHKFTVTSADAGWYFCRAQNSEGHKDSKLKELMVKFAPKHTNIMESAEKQELDGRSSVMLSCISHSFPPVHKYSWYRKSKGEKKEKDEIVSKHQNHSVYSNQSGVYHCIAQNEADHSLSDPVHLFEGDYLESLRFLVLALLLLMIISVIVVNLRYWRKSVQQGTTNTGSPSGFSNEPESLQDYDDIGNVTARAPTSRYLFDDHTSEGEVELDFPQVRFTARPRRQTANRDSSSSHEDESFIF